MYLHLGQETTIRMKDVIGLFDLDNSTLSKHTRAFLAKAEKQGRVVNTSQELPRSFVVTVGAKPRVFVSQLSTATLKKRLELVEQGKY